MRLKLSARRRFIQTLSAAIIEPLQELYAIFAEAMGRSGYAAATLTSLASGIKMGGPKTESGLA